MQYPLTVLIPTHGRPRLLKRTLESLKACTLPDSYRELVVIENGSRDGAEAVVTNIPERLNARYVHRERGNKSYALNEALETIEAGLVVFFDDDVRVDPGTLVAYAEAAAQTEGGIFFGGPVSASHESPPSTLLRSFYPLSAQGYCAESARELSFYLGANWAAYATDIKALGGFDTRFGPGSRTGATGQETDMQRRMRDSGIKPKYVSAASVTHYVPEERASLQWLLTRYKKVGIMHGINSQYGAFEMSARIAKDQIASLCVLTKSILTLDKRKIVFVLLNTSERIGTIKGYLYRFKKTQ